MKLLQSLIAITAAVFFSTSAIAEDAKPAEWLFVHTAQTAEMTSDTTLSYASNERHLCVYGQTKPYARLHERT